MISFLWKSKTISFTSLRMRNNVVFPSWTRFFVKLTSCVAFGSASSASFFESIVPIEAEYGEILGISPYSVQMRENTDHRNFRIWHFSGSALVFKWIKIVKGAYKKSLKETFILYILHQLVWFVFEVFIILFLFSFRRFL